MKEIVFEVTREADGGYIAEAIGESIFTQADNWDELRANIREAVHAFYFDSPPSASKEYDGRASLLIRRGEECTW